MKDRLIIGGAMALGLVLLFVIIIGCSGSSGGPEVPTESSNETPSESTTGFVGLIECYNCHADDANPAGLANVVGDSSVSKAAGTGWLSGPHANNETIDAQHNHLDLSPDNVGFPDYGYGPGLGTSPVCTTECHDPRGDGTLLEDFYAKTGITAIGVVNRPVVGCESCHGPGGAHFGTGPLVYNSPGPDRCEQCHNSDFDHNKYHPEGDNIHEDYASSPHSHSINSHVYVRGTTDVRGYCAACHTDEGARGARGDLEDASNVQCRTCHDAHNPDELLVASSTNALNVTSSAEYNTCTTCHQVSDGMHGENNGHDWTGATPPSFTAGLGNFESSGIIYDTHFDNPDTPNIEGYVLDSTSERVCRDCHNVHSSDNEINEQWAKSAHGGYILEIKELAFANVSDPDPAVAIENVMAILNGTDLYGAVTEYGTPFNAPAWAHADFRTYARGHCVRCHTSTGYRNLADGTSVEFTVTGEQKEMLYCWACHSYAGPGELRDPGALADTAQYSTPAARIAAVPDTEGSNVCMACHSGRKSGEGIKGAALDVINSTAFSSYYPHYTSAGGTLFRTIGFEYGSPDYDDVNYFMHDDIGTSSVSGTGDNGPCVGCHMEGDAGHTFEPVTHDGAGLINGITAFDATCSVCHGSESGLVADISTTLKVGYANALDVLDAQLQAKGYHYNSARPYFYNSTYIDGYVESGDCTDNLPVLNWQSGGTTTYIWNSGDEDCDSDAVVLVDGDNATGWNNMGAAFNFYVLHYEPGAYAHNSNYTKRLIFDSIDWLDNESLGASIDLSASPEAAEWYQGDGITSNDNSVTRP
jgi:hypothetical protein